MPTKTKKAKINGVVVKPDFHVVALRTHGKLQGYEIYFKDTPFLVMYEFSRERVLKRHEAYAICRLLNNELMFKKWAEKFEDPYK